MICDFLLFKIQFFIEKEKIVELFVYIFKLFIIFFNLNLVSFREGSRIFVKEVCRKGIYIKLYRNIGLKNVLGQNCL